MTHVFFTFLRPLHFFSWLLMKIILLLSWFTCWKWLSVLYYLTICAEGVVCWADGAGEQHPLQASIVSVNVQLGQGDGILDDGWDVWWWWWQVPGAPSWPWPRAFPSMPKGACEESGCFGAVCWVWASWLPHTPIVAKEGSVPKHVSTAANMHSMSEVTQRWADHVHREFTLKATFPLRARHKALNPWQLSQTHGGRKVV